MKAKFRSLFLLAALFLVNSLIPLKAQTNPADLPTNTGAIPASNFLATQPPAAIDLRNYFAVTGITGQVVQFTFNVGAKFNVEMNSTLAPNTVANFLAYLSANSYADSIIHRSDKSLGVIQGGGFLNNSTLGSIATNAPLALEAGDTLTNGRGTISMARTSDPNSATSEWFINTADNSVNLPPASAGGYAVFGRITGTGMNIVDAVAALPVPGGTLTVTSSTTGGSQVTVNAATLPANFGQGWGLFGTSVSSISGNIVTLAGTATQTITSATPVAWSRFGPPFDQLPVLSNLPANNSVSLSNLVTLGSVQAVPVFPTGAGVPAVVTFSAVSSNPLIAASISGSTLNVATTGNVNATGTVTVTATDSNGNSAHTSFNVTATAVPAQIVSPVNGTNLGATSVNFTWNTAVGASAYALYMGSAPGVFDIYAKFEGTSLSDTVNNLPADGSTVYVRLYSYINGTWLYNSYIYTAADNRARLTSPANGTAMTSTSVALTWSTGTGVGAYALYVGSSPGAADIYAKAEGTSLTDTVSNLPADGRTIYVTLYSYINGKWLPVSYNYTAVDNRTQMASPAGGAALTGTTATFNWNASTGASAYALYVGNTPGAHDLYAKAEGSSLTDTVNSLPSDGRTIYVNLWSFINGQWVSRSYYYTAVDNRAQMIGPINGSALGSSSATFTWSAGTGASAYALYVGSSPGGNDLYAKAEGTSLTDTVNNLPVDGRPIYVTLWSLINGNYRPNNYNYTASDNRAQMTSPVNGSVIGTPSVSFTWSAGTGASAYALYVGSAPGVFDIYAKAEGASLTDTVNIPSGSINGHTLYVRLYSYLNGAWVYNSYVYTASDTKAQLTAPSVGTPLASASATFSWSAGTGVSAYALYIGSSPGVFDLYAKAEGSNLSDTVNNLPVDGRRIYVRLYSLTSAGWKFNAYTYDAFTSPTGPLALLTSPTDGSTLSASSAVFTWSAGTGAAAYALYVGSTPANYDIDATAEKSDLTDTVSNLPQDGSPVYVTLWSLLNGQWQGTKTHYSTAVQGTSPKGLLTGPSPANGSKLTAGQLALTWSAAASQGTQYALYVGSAPFATDIYAKAEGSSLSDTVPVPVDGRRLFVTLWTLVNGSWQPTTYYYDTTE